MLPSQAKAVEDEAQDVFQDKRRGEKEFGVGFLAVARYPKWVVNIVPVPKKDGKMRCAWTIKI